MQQPANWIDPRQRQQVCGTALEHSDPSGLLREDGQESYSRSAATNDYYLLTRVIEIFRPGLRVDKLSIEIVETGNGGFERFVVVVVARTQDQEARCDTVCTIVCVDVEAPFLVVRRPACCDKPMLKLDVAINAVLFG